MFGWSDRETKATAKLYIGGDKPACIYSIGKYLVTVPGVTPEAELPVTYREDGRYGKPTDTLPNMEITDGVIRIPITDLVEQVLERSEPVEIAQTLWQDENVRNAFIDCLVTRYNEQGVGDADRRKFLQDVKEAVHSKALDCLSSKMASLEYDVAKRSFFYHEVNAVNDMLANADYKRLDGTPIRLRHEDSDPDFKIGGKHWNDAQAFWRAEVAKLFPFYESTNTEPTEDVNDVP